MIDSPKSLRRQAIRRGVVFVQWYIDYRLPQRNQLGLYKVFFSYEPLKLKFKHLPLEKNWALNQVSHMVAITHSQLLLRKRQDLALYVLDTEYHTSSNIYI